MSGFQAGSRRSVNRKQRRPSGASKQLKRGASTVPMPGRRKTCGNIRWCSPSYGFRSVAFHRRKAWPFQPT